MFTVTRAPLHWYLSKVSIDSNVYNISADQLYQSHSKGGVHGQSCVVVSKQQLGGSGTCFPNLEAQKLLLRAKNTCNSWQTGF